MKAYRKIVLPLAISLLVGQHTIAQSARALCTIRGVVADSITRAPLDHLAVTLLQNGAVVKMELTQVDGSFIFTGLRRAAYGMQVQGVGYAAKAMPVVTSTDSITDLGVIYLAATAQTLDAVVIKGRRPLVRQEADRIAYDLQADPESKVSSVLDMMRKVPYLSVDGNGNVLLKGSAGYRIFINGKPSGLVERNPRDVLRSMPASTIKSIEVITNPPARYDAEGMAGIINIITIKQVDNGYQAAVNINGKAPAGGPGVGGMYTLRQGRLGMSALAGGSLAHTPATIQTGTRTTTAPGATELVQTSRNTARNKSGYAGLEISYELDSLQLLSAQLNVNGNKATGATGQQSSLTGNGGILQQYDLQNDNIGKGGGVDASMNYQLGFKASKQQSLTLSYRYMGYTNHADNNVQVARAVNYLLPGYRQGNAESLSEHTFQLDYVQPLKKMVMEAGIKGIFRNNKSDFQYNLLKMGTGTYEPVDSLSNVFSNRQQVLAAYNSYDYRINTWQVKAGVRVEQTLIRGGFAQGQPGIGQKYLNLVPSIVVGKKLDGSSSLNLSFANRVQRPSIAQLNPFVNRANPSFQSTGNPALRPTTSNLLQLSYLRSKKTTVNVALGYIFFNRVIGPITSYDSATKVTLTSFENANKGRVLKVNIYLNCPITSQWNVSLNADIRQVAFYAPVAGVVLKSDGAMAYANVSTGYSFKKGWRANAGATMNTGGVSSAQGKTSGFVSTVCSINKELVNNKLTIAAAVNNPFTKYRHIHDQLQGDDFVQVTDSQSYFRSFTISVNYRLGRLTGALKKSKISINNDDLLK